MSADVTRRIASFAHEVRVGGAPDDVRRSARQRIIDIVGLQLAALRLPTSQAALRFVAEQGGAAQASVVGAPARVPAAWAAFANGVLAHSLDYDDTHLPSVLHPSAGVVPAALAVAESVGAEGDAVLDAVAAGIEVTVRLGMAGYDRESNNSIYFEHGQHATSICGTIGAAVAAGMLHGFDADRLTDVIGVAASMASGVIEANRTGGTVKRMHCGWAAHAGATAAELVRHGFTGPPTALEGRFGLFEGFLHGRVDLAAVTDGLGEEWAVPGIFFKPYPANHFTHTAVDAARRVRERGIRPSDVTAVTLEVATPTVRTIGEPLAVKQSPETGYQAQFSGPFAVTVGLFGGEGLGAGLGDYTDELAQDAERRALMAKVEVVGSPECDAIYPFQFPCVLRVTTAAGDTVVEKVLVNRGGPADPLSDDELAVKFSTNAQRALAPEAVATLLSTLSDRLDVVAASGVLRTAASSPALATAVAG
ncbi:MmgE/PrpD family protein [Microbacterium sp. 179-I 3D2 NHS]|uniref:MmgE/PrpD family protein n=1 Tax=Microbacterium sp. 179-I 3D2 NHS TaxID=3235178 RepID=UPI0039A04151